MMPISNTSHLSTAAKNYAFRRLIYNLMVSAHSIILCRQETKSIPNSAVMKICGLIMARNINDFLFNLRKTTRPYDDDIFAADFNLSNWIPDQNNRLTKPIKDRINKIAGHIVSKDPKHFGDLKTIEPIIIPLICEGCYFANKCFEQSKAKYTGNARKYQEYLNKALCVLDLSDYVLKIEMNTNKSLNQ
jgi:hypothetical protein